MKKKKQIPVYLEERAIRSNSGGASLHHLSKSCGFEPITLGPLVLRCETAAVYALSVLSYELQNS